MHAVILRARSELRARRRMWIGLTVLIGLSAGVVLATAAGGRRTDTAYARFERAQNAADVFVFPAFSEQFGSVDFNAVARLREVADSSRIAGLTVTDSDLELQAPVDGVTPRRLNVPKLLDGRMPDDRSVDEVALPFDYADKAGLRVGDRLTVHIAPTFVPNGGADPGARPTPVRLRVVGIEASPSEFPPLEGTNSQMLHVSRALLTTYRPRFGAFEALVVKLRSPDLAESFERHLVALGNGRPVLDARLSEQAANVQRSLHTQALALWLTAGVLAAVVILVVAQLFARQAVIEASDHMTLRTVGLTTDQLRATALARGVIVGVGAAAVAGVTAVVGSRFFPIGLAKVAEPHPGISVDLAVVATGMAAVAAVVAALMLVTGWGVAGRTATAVEAGGHAAASLPLPAPAGVGVRMALQRGAGRTAVPVRSSLASVVIALIGVVAAVTFAASLAHLLDTPRLYGAAWDAQVVTTGNDPVGPVAARLAREPAIDAVAIIDSGVPAATGGARMDLLAIGNVKGAIDPTVASGRAPERPGEILLGTRTAAQLHKHIGDEVPVRITAIEGPTAPFRVVGTGVLPAISDNTQLGRGAVITYDSEKLLVPPGVTAPPPSTAFVRFAADTPRAQAEAALRRRVKAPFFIAQPPKPDDIVNFGRVRGLPLVLAAFLVFLAAATLAQTLLTSVRRRRRDLAVLKTLGFVPAQVRWAVVWQATTFSVLALVVAAPIGIALGRWTWAAFAHQVAALPEPVTPWALLAIVPAVLVLANAVAAFPAAVAGRMSPAGVLRSE